jgi:enoyl-CoA hydratase/carnithine racemase
MISAPLPGDVLARAGLPAAQAQAWADSAPPPGGEYAAAAAALSRFLAAGAGLLGRLPARAHCGGSELAARNLLTGLMHTARDSFLRAHAGTLYDTLTGGGSRWPRVEELVAGAAAAVPHLVPSEAELAAERARALAAKEGIEFAHGLLVGHVLALPHAGSHLVHSMLRPLPEALDRLPGLMATGRADLGPVLVTRRGRAGVLELRNPRHLNAEDDVTLRPTECAVDLILLDPGTDIGVIRGGVVDRPGYAGERVFGAGLNLTRLYHGRIDFLFFLVRDLGFVNKIFRGIAAPPGEAAFVPAPEGEGCVPAPAGAGLVPAGGGPQTTISEAGGTLEKLWVAAVERFAVGGACQLLHVVDHVIATRGSRLFLPARKEGIIPGASNLRLPRFVGDRAARQAILSGREWAAGDPDAAPLCDEVVEPGDMDRALASRIGALTSSGLVNAAANRRALRVAAEPLEAFRSYMATFCLEQARCHLSPALVRNLETHWNARERSL